MFFKKKKVENQDLKDIFKDDELGHKEKKVSKEDIKKRYDIKSQNEEIIENLEAIKSNVVKSTNEDISSSDLYLDIDETIRKLANVEVDNNARAVYAINGFISKMLKQYKEASENNNYFELFTYNDELNKLLTERKNVTSKKYENAEYVKVRLELLKVNSLVAAKQNDLARLGKRYDEFYKSGKEKTTAEQKIFAQNLKDIITEEKNIKRQISQYETRKQQFSNVLSSIESTTDNYVSEEMLEIVENTITNQKEIDAQNKQMEKLTEKLTEANKVMRDNDMTFKDTNVEEEEDDFDFASLERK